MKRFSLRTRARGLAVRRASALSAVCALGVVAVLSAEQARADSVGPCNPSAYPAASESSLAACGVVRVPITDVESLPGGGSLYQYTLADGQVVSYPETPPNFDGATASVAEQGA